MTQTKKEKALAIFKSIDYRILASSGEWKNLDTALILKSSKSVSELLMLRYKIAIKSVISKSDLVDLDLRLQKEIAMRTNA